MVFENGMVEYRVERVGEIGGEEIIDVGNVVDGDG